MSIANKTRALLNLTERKPADLSECLGISVQAVRNKFSRGSFSISDLLKICAFLDCEMSIHTKGGQTVTFTIDDIEQGKNPGAGRVVERGAIGTDTAGS